jgi:hypothetical protein
VPQHPTRREIAKQDLYHLMLQATFAAVLVLATMLPSTWTDGEVIRPRVRLELHLSAEDVPELRQLLLRFAEAQGLQVVDVGAKLPISRVMPPVKGRRPFMVELRRRDIKVLATDFMETNRFLIAIYEYKPSAEARQIASEFEDLLRKRWPDELKPFVDR